MAETIKAQNKKCESKDAIALAETEEMEFEIDLYDLFITIVEKWYWVVLAAIIGTIIAVFYSAHMVTPQYEATSKIYVVNSKDSVINLSALQVANSLTSDYLQAFDNWELHERVMKRLGLDYTYSRLSKMIRVRNPVNTRVLAITCTSPDPLMAQSLANTYAELSVDFFPEKLDTSSPKLFEKALLPSAPVSPNKMRNAVMGLLAGVILAISAIFIFYLNDDYVRTEDDVERYLNLPTLGTMMLQQDDKLFESVEEDYDEKAVRRKE